MYDPEIKKVTVAARTKAAKSGSILPFKRTRTIKFTPPTVI